ncbi:hypothetical protein [Paenibacillus tepidiphilus]|uniref:hypothetical protein n=1 Tax=Paenibacillus tepidiphilus TaxID=2608683 RepID=UPI0013A5751E|nr:hypothetical protein [Paenibacillus tepidiphilus]
MENNVGIMTFGDLPEDPEHPLPLQKTDWSPLYGIVKDKFGVTFQVNVPGEQRQG